MGAVTIKVITRSGKPLCDVSVGSEVRAPGRAGQGPCSSSSGPSPPRPAAPPSPAADARPPMAVRPRNDPRTPSRG
jgi:hypothetical protein